MKSTTKNNRNQKTSNLPLSIGLGVRAAAQLGAAVLYFHLFGNGFLGVVLSLLFCSNLLRGLLACSPPSC